MNAMKSTAVFGHWHICIMYVWSMPVNVWSAFSMIKTMQRCDSNTWNYLKNCRKKKNCQRKIRQKRKLYLHSWQKDAVRMVYQNPLLNAIWRYVENSFPSSFPLSRCRQKQTVYGVVSRSACLETERHFALSVSWILIRLGENPIRMVPVLIQRPWWFPGLVFRWNASFQNQLPAAAM